MSVYQIRGTSGSGKTYSMRETMKLLKATYGEPSPKLIEGRKKPISYDYSYDGKKVSVLGSYDEDAACGGCDTIHGYELLVATVLDRAKAGYTVIMEGLLLSEDTKQTLLINEQVKVQCIFLVTPIETCIERIKGRRAAKGNEKPLNEENTRKRVATIQRARIKLEENGILCRGATCEQVPQIIMSWITGTKFVNRIKMVGGNGSKGVRTYNA